MAKSTQPAAKVLTRQRLNDKVAEAKKRHASANKSGRGNDRPGGAPASKKGRKTPDKERIKDLEAALAKANKELEKREKQLADKENQPGGNLPQLIAKPKGSAGDGFNLVEAMGLDGDTDLYDAVRRNVRENASGVGLDWRKDFRSQDVALLARAYKLGRSQFPFLSKYVNDWPQAEIIRQWFANRRRHGVREGFFPKRKDRIVGAAIAGHVALVDGAPRKKPRKRQTNDEDDEMDDENEEMDDENEERDKEEEGGNRGSKGDEQGHAEQDDEDEEDNESE